MTKKITHLGNFKPHLLADELQAALSWTPVTAEGTTRLQSRTVTLEDESEATQVEIFADDDTDEAAVQAVIDAHDPNALSVGEQHSANVEDVNLRLKASVLAGKTPTEIYQIVQNRIDGWSSLAEAKSDMREWFPLLFAATFWLVRQERD